MSNRAIVLCLLGLAACGSAAQAPTTPVEPPAPPPPADRSVILFVWDGLRWDGANAEDTPNLVRLRDGGVEFTDNHSTYPTFTMMNSASFATGQFSEATGFYGNVLWQPTATGNDSAGKPVDFRQPVFSEDYGVLDGLKAPGKQLLADTLFGAAQAAGMVTLAVGKSGAAYLMDTGRGGLLLDEKTALPLAFARELQAAGVALPPTTPGAYGSGELVLGPDNGNPVEFKPVAKLKDTVSTDPVDDHGSPYKGALDYLTTAYLDHVLPDKHPRLTVVWLRDPDTTEHAFGIGTANWRDALRANDALLGKLLARLDALGLRDKTDLIVVSDHGHSNVSGPQDLFPLRAVAGGAVGDIDLHGHSVSGMVRIADLLRRAGFTAFDGLGCTFIPVAMGIRKDGSPVYPTQVDADGKLCGKEGQKYQAPPYKVPAELPAHALVVAVNGGSDYIYVPDHDPALVKKTVGFLQSRAEVGAIFVDDRYGAIPGTLPLGAIHARNAAGKNPDIILSYDYDETALVEGTPGTEMAGVLNGSGYRGMHGSFSPRDVHNSLIATGPDFRAGFKDPLPSGNVDVAPTIARILGLRLAHAQGRPLLEALAHGAAVTDYHVEPAVQRPQAPATGVTVHLPTDRDGKDVAAKPATYSFELHTKQLSYGKQSYMYFDFAKASRR
ncbi:MAG TPA: alkaline phosphatase family protein [Kofleriaceae bacterium]|jgi:arylsulfatase A-like enzyme|nr:alkaline phosphatase family protein [Kofleriaceae bacterium]